MPPDWRCGEILPCAVLCIQLPQVKSAEGVGCLDDANGQCDAHNSC